MGDHGPLPSPNARRRNRRATSGTIASRRPVMPRTLSAEAKREWRRVVPELVAMGWIATVDRGALIRYCTIWADWVELDEALQRSGKLTRGRDGTPVRNPLWLMRRDAADMAANLARDLGLSPAARLRNGVKHEPPAPDADAPTALDDYRKRMGAR